MNLNYVIKQFNARMMSFYHERRFNSGQYPISG